METPFELQKGRERLDASRYVVGTGGEGSTASCRRRSVGAADLYRADLAHCRLHARRSLGPLAGHLSRGAVGPRLSLSWRPTVGGRQDLELPS